MTIPMNRKNIQLILLAVVVLIVGGLLAGKFIIERKIEALALADLALDDQMLKLESGKVDASFLTASITYSDIVYSIKDAPGALIHVGKIKLKGMDRASLMGKPGDVTSIEKTLLENMNVTFNKMEQPLLEIGKCEVADLAFNYRDIRAALLQNKDNEDSMAVLAALLQVAKNSPTKSGPSRMEDLKINLKQLGLADLRFGLITDSGLRELDKASEGFEGAVDEIVVKDISLNAVIEDISFDAAGERGAALAVNLDSIVCKGLKYNYRELYAALLTFSETQNPEDLLPALLSTAYNYELTEFRAENLNFSSPDDNSSFTMGSLVMGPHNIKEQGPHVASGIKVNANGMDIFTLEAIGVDKIIFSDLLVDILSNSQRYQNAEFFGKVMEDPFMLANGMQIKNLYLKNLNVQDMVSLAGWQADMNIRASETADLKPDVAAELRNLKINSRVDSFCLSPTTLMQLGLGLFGSGGYAQDVFGMLAAHPDGLAMDSKLDLDMNIQKNTLDFDSVFELGLRQLGAFTLKLKGLTDSPEYYENYGEPLISRVESSLSDEGFLENLYAYMAAQGYAANAAAVKENLLKELNAEIAQANGLQIQLLGGLRTFMEKGGHLSIKMQPELPQPFDFFSAFIISPANYRLEITHELPKQN